MFPGFRSEALVSGKRGACPTIRQSHQSMEKCCRAGATSANLLRWVILLGFLSGCPGNNELSTSLRFVSHRQPVLANERAFRAFKAAVGKLQHWTVLAAVLMPDHLHVIVSPTDARDAKLGNFSAALKRWIRRELNAEWKWQPDCFDRLLRSDESLHEKWLYVQDNLVRAGLVELWADWPYRIGLDE